jgi:hypothetical protein
VSCNFGLSSISIIHLRSDHLFSAVAFLVAFPLFFLSVLLSFNYSFLSTQFFDMKEILSLSIFFLFLSFSSFPSLFPLRFVYFFSLLRSSLLVPLSFPFSSFFHKIQFCFPFVIFIKAQQYDYNYIFISSRLSLFVTKL